jgi:hypothetical protein
MTTKKIHHHHHHKHHKKHHKAHHKVHHGHIAHTAKAPRVWLHLYGGGR